MEVRYDTYCGLYCGGCEVFLINKRGIVDEKAKEWDMKPEDLKCNGCKTATVSAFCRSCKIKKCAETKGIEFCYQCPDYPCMIIKDFKNDEHPHHSIVLHNLSSIKENGLAKWLEEQEKRWSCSACGEKISWYEENCLKCGNLIRSSLVDDEELRNQ